MAYCFYIVDPSTSFAYDEMYNNLVVERPDGTHLMTLLGRPKGADTRGIGDEPKFAPILICESGDYRISQLFVPHISGFLLKMKHEKKARHYTTKHQVLLDRLQNVTTITAVSKSGVKIKELRNLDVKETRTQVSQMKLIPDNKLCSVCDKVCGFHLPKPFLHQVFIIRHAPDTKIDIEMPTDATWIFRKCTENGEHQLIGSENRQAIGPNGHICDH